MSTLGYHFPEFAIGAVHRTVFVRSSGDVIERPAAIPGSARPRTAGLGGLLTAITR